MSAPALQGDGAALVPPADHPAHPAVVPIHIAMAAAMAEVTAVGKDGINQDQHYKFRGVDAVVNALGPALRRHGVFPLPMLETIERRDVTTSRGKPSRETTCQVRYRFIGPAGDHLDAVVPGESMDTSDKGTAKAMSVAYRIALLQVFALPTHDPDPDSTQPERGTEADADREQPRPEPEQPSGPSPRALGIVAAGLARRMLDADGDALKRMWSEVFESPARDVDVSGLLGEHRDTLGVREGEVVPLIALRARVATRIEQHQCPVSDPTPIGAGEPADPPDHPEPAEPTEQQT